MAAWIQWTAAPDLAPRRMNCSRLRVKTVGNPPIISSTLYRRGNRSTETTLQISASGGNYCPCRHPAGGRLRWAFHPPTSTSGAPLNFSASLRARCETGNPPTLARAPFGTGLPFYIVAMRSTTSAWESRDEGLEANARREGTNAR